MSAERIASMIIAVQRRFGQVRNLRRIAQLGLPSASIIAREQSGAHFRIENMPAEFTAYLQTEHAQIFATKAAEVQVADFEAAVDAASLIFSHSVADAAIFELCEITASVRPSDWEHAVSSKKLSLSDVQGMEYSGLLQAAVAAHIRQVERDSLPEKIKKLIALCRPGAGILSYSGYQFSEERLSQIDQERHEVTHNAGPRLVETIDGDIDFLERTVFALMAAVMEKYDLGPSTRQIENAIRQGGTEAPNPGSPADR